MNGYNDIIAEPSDDEDLAIACGFEVINEEDLYNMISMPYHQNPPMSSSSSSSHRRGNGKLPSNKSPSSFASAASSVAPSIFKKPSSCSLSSQGSEMSDVEDFCLAESGGDSDDGVYEEDDHQLSVENLWYMIQQKRHLNHDVEEEMRMLHHHFLTMEHASHHNHNRLTEWFANLIHFPEKLRQHAAEKHRFNINKAPKEIRDELKHIYVY